MTASVATETKFCNQKISVKLQNSVFVTPPPRRGGGPGFDDKTHHYLLFKRLELISCPLACPPAWPKTNALKPFVKRGRHSFYLNLHWLASLQLYDEIDSRSFRPISTTAIVRSSSHHQRKRRCKMFVTEGTTDNTYAEPQSRLAVESELFFSRCISYAEELNGD